MSHHLRKGMNVGTVIRNAQNIRLNRAFAVRTIKRVSVDFSKRQY